MLSRDTARAFARAGVAAAAVTLVVTTASPAFADTAQGRIESLTPQPDGHLSVVFSATGLRPKFLDKLAAHGVHVDTSIFAFEKFGG